MKRVFERTEKAGYHQFVGEDGSEYGSFEVVFLSRDCDETPEDDYGKRLASGWYWAAGFPGCLWDGEPCGPFRSSKSAYNDAMEF